MLAALLSSQSAGTPATALVLPGIAVFSAAPGSAIGSAQQQTRARGGRPVWRRITPPEQQWTPPPLVLPAVASVPPGRIEARSAPCRAIGVHPGVARVAPGVMRALAVPGSAVVSARAITPPGMMRAAGAPARVSGAAVARPDPSAAAWRAAAGVASGAARPAVSLGATRVAARSVAATGYRGPSPEEIAAALLLLDDDEQLVKAVQLLDRDRPIVTMMRLQLQQIVADFLRDLGHRVAAAARTIGKAAADDKEGAVAATESADYEPLQQDAQARIREIAKDGAHRGLEQVRADVARLLSQANKRAVAWADERAAEMIAEVSTTTRDRVRTLVRQAEEEGWSNDELADELAGDGVFSAGRAERIARTETAMADVQGNLIGWKESGVVAQKEWAIAQDSVCDICEPFDGMVVDLDEEFPEGDPPVHPNCRCDVLPVMSEEEA